MTKLKARLLLLLLREWATRKIQRNSWMIKIVWRNANHRWYIFRDAPDWVVCEYLKCGIAGLEAQAFDEMELRLDGLARRIERMES